MHKKQSLPRIRVISYYLCKNELCNRFFMISTLQHMTLNETYFSSVMKFASLVWGVWPFFMIQWRSVKDQQCIKSTTITRPKASLQCMRLMSDQGHWTLRKVSRYMNNKIERFFMVFTTKFGNSAENIMVVPPPSILWILVLVFVVLGPNQWFAKFPSCI